MSDIAQGNFAKIVLKPGDSYRVTTSGVATVESRYGAPAGTTTVTANSVTFGPYNVDASLKVTATTGTCSVLQVINTAMEMGTDGTLSPASAAAVRGAATPVYDAEDQTLAIPGGPVVSLAAPAVSFANLPVPAAGNAGVVYRVTDIGLPGAGAFLQSTGTGWRPLGGRALLAAGSSTVAAPLASLAVAGKFTLPTGGMVTGGSLVLPAGLFWTGAVVRCVAKLRHRGTGGTWTATVRLGTLNTSSDSSFASANGAATNDQIDKIDSEAEFTSATGYMADTFATPNAPTTGALVDRNTNINTAAVMYAGIYVGTVNAADFVDLVSYRFELVG